VDIFSRLDRFIERASRAPIENDENWTDVCKKKEGERNGNYRDARDVHLKFAFYRRPRNTAVGRFFGRAQNNLDEKTRSVTQSGDPSVDFDKRTRRGRCFL